MPAQLDPARVVLRDQLEPARSLSFILRRGCALRLTDREGGANCAALFYNAQQPLERYNMADTLKCQHTAYIHQGVCLYSDMGRVMLSVTEDSAGWHDTFCGISDAAQVRAKYGEHGYQQYRNGFYRSGRELFLVELGKHGLGKRDLVANVNFFSKVVPDADGRLSFVPGASAAGRYVDLRAEMDLLMVLHSAPHPLDPNPAWAPRPVDLTVYRADPVAEDDPCLNARPENARGFALTRRYHCQCEH